MMGAPLEMADSGGDGAMGGMDDDESPVDVLRGIAAERPDQTVAMLKQWLENNTAEEAELVQ